MGDNHQVYISYAWGGESERIVNELDTDLQTKGILVVRDKRDLGFKGMIRDFMQQIGRGHAIIVVISDKYLKSPNCMFELVEIAKNKDLYDRVFPIVLGDADIYNPVNRIKYIKHWEEKLKELDEAMRSVSSANLQGVRDEIDSYDEIRDNISNLTFFLKDMNTLTPEMHENSNFASLINALERRIAQARDELMDAVSASVSVKPASSTSTPITAPAASAASFDAYLKEVTNRLVRDEYKELRGERAGGIKFKKAMELVRKGFLGAKDYYRVLFVQPNNLDDASFIELEQDIKSYGRELSKKLISNMFITCVVLASEAPESVKEIIYTTERTKVGITDVSIVVMVAYSAAENDIFYPSDLPDEYNSKFEENIKEYLIP
ncbi:MAG: toll/interleukin-1 receptor domain-containing protein [Chloroflexota bacterium]|nr:toll/interleukin-1 receptor domain-containing protein [Chloroflexota bacterium]